MEFQQKIVRPEAVTEYDQEPSRFSSCRILSRIARKKEQQTFDSKRYQILNIKRTQGTERKRQGKGMDGRLIDDEKGGEY